MYVCTYVCGSVCGETDAFYLQTQGTESGWTGRGSAIHYGDCVDALVRAHLLFLRTMKGFQ